MTPSDAEFLVEVDRFLASTTFSSLPVAIASRNDSPNGMLSPLSNSKASQRLVAIAPHSNYTRNRRLTAQHKQNDVTKRELEKAKDRKRRQLYRERRRIERESLLQAVEELTEELKQSKGLDNVFASTWKMLADRQRTAREAAEAEQRQLIKAIDTRAALLNQFQALLNERVDGLNDSPERKAFKHKRVRLEPTDDAIFAAYIRELDEVYAKTDDILRSRGLDSAEPNWDEPSETWIKDPTTGYFLFGGKLTLPFDFREICRSRWHTAPLHHRQESRQIYQSVEDPANTIAFKFRITIQLASGKIASVLQRVAVRRYKENERMVIVWRLFTEGEGVFNGMNADETGWNVAVPATNSTKTGTVMLTCVRNVPMHLNSTENCQPTVKQFAGKLVEWGSENNSRVTNLLLTGK